VDQDHSKRRCCPCPDGGVKTARTKDGHPLLQLVRPKLTAPWPMMGADFHRSGLARRAGPRIGLKAKPRVAWKFRTGGRVSGGVVIDRQGRVYFGSHDGAVYALDRNGSLLWKVQTGDKVWATPALADDGRLLVVGSDDDHLYGIETGGGRKESRPRPGGRLRFKVELGGCGKNSVQKKGTQRAVRRKKPKTQKKKRSTTAAKTAARRSPPLSPHAAPDTVRCDVDSAPAIDALGRIVVGGEGLTVLDVQGRVQVRFDHRRHTRSSPALRADGTIFFGSRDDRLYALDGDGKLLWSYVTQGDVDGSPAIALDGTVYVGSDDGRLYALWPDGEMRWAVVTGGPVRSSPAVGPDGTVYFGSHDGKFYAVEPKTGKAKWIFRTGGRIQASPIIDKAGRIYVGSQDGRLYALDSTGKLMWSHRFNDDVDSPPAIGPHGRLYLGCDDGYVYVLTSN
jgi:outer membrane protein assembly factor BamB